MPEIFVHTEPASGCHPDASFLEVTEELGVNDRPDEFEAFWVESTDSMWAVLLRTARCCGSDYIVVRVFDTEDEARMCCESEYAHREPALTDWEEDVLNPDEWPAAVRVARLHVLGEVPEPDLSVLDDEEIADAEDDHGQVREPEFWNGFAWQEAMSSMGFPDELTVDDLYDRSEARRGPSEATERTEEGERLAELTFHGYGHRTQAIEFLRGLIIASDMELGANSTPLILAREVMDDWKAESRAATTVLKITVPERVIPLAKLAAKQCNVDITGPNERVWYFA